MPVMSAMAPLLSSLLLLIGAATLLEAGSTDPAPLPSAFLSTSTRATFVPPACPTVTRSSEGLLPSSSALFSKKKVSPKKLQVKLLKHVAGTGQAGEVVQVTPAFFQNKLRPTKSATPISDEEVAAQETEAKKQEEARDAAALVLKERLTDYELHISRKGGPEGKLFGGISPKVILDELRSQVSDDYWDEKQVKIASVTQEGKKMRGDIKHTGEFEATVSLTKDISAKVKLQVDAEEHS